MNDNTNTKINLLLTGLNVLLAFVGPFVAVWLAHYWNRRQKKLDEVTDMLVKLSGDVHLLGNTMQAHVDALGHKPAPGLVKNKYFLPERSSPYDLMTSPQMALSVSFRNHSALLQLTLPDDHQTLLRMLYEFYEHFELTMRRTHRRPDEEHPLADASKLQKQITAEMLRLHEKYRVASERSVDWVRVRNIVAGIDRTLPGANDPYWAQQMSTTQDEPTTRVLPD